MSSSREDILRAARKLFAERGYQGATVRAIAAEAGVDAALVVHFFGTKATLLGPAPDAPSLCERPARAVGASPYTVIQARELAADAVLPRLRRPGIDRTRVTLHYCQATNSRQDSTTKEASHGEFRDGAQARVS